MTKNRFKLRLTLSKKQQKRLKKILPPIGIGLLGFFTGIVGTVIISSRHTPANLVWAADANVKMPKDLRTFLENRNDCHEYRGAGSPTGVGLWGVYQVSRDRYAKIAYGCSWHLSSYIMAVRQKHDWQLLRPAEYFAPFKDGINPSQGALPYCSVIERYKIPDEIESFCITNDGSAQSNSIK